jgi:Cupin domain
MRVTREPVLDAVRMKHLEIVQRRLAVISRPLADHQTFSRRFQLMPPARCRLVESSLDRGVALPVARKTEGQPLAAQDSARRGEPVYGTLMVCLTNGGAVVDVILKRFDNPDEVRSFTKGKFEIVHIAGVTVGRATYEPGWTWSEHIGRALGQKSCDVEHIGIVIQGRATAEMDDGRVVELHPGDIFYVPPGHDSRVIGDEQYVSLHLIGAGAYTR